MDLQSRNKRRSAAFISFLFLTTSAYAQQPPNRPPLPRPLLYKLQGPAAFKERLAAQKTQTSKPMLPASGKKACPPNCDELLAKMQKHGPQMIVVNLKRADLPDYIHAPKADRARLIEARRQAITAMQDRVLGRLSVQNIKFKNVTVSKYAPSIGITADSTMLKALMVDPEVESIEENVIMHLMLNQSVPLIGADVAWTNGFTGNGYTIAILDTGVDTSHPFLAGKVLDEHCFSTNDSGTDPVLGPWTITSLCPNRQAEQAGAGAAQPCTLAGCEHGTHVAGIAAGHSYVPIAFSGVAKDATLDAIQVFSVGAGQAVCGNLPSPCLISLYQNHQSALQYVSTLFANVAAVNLSLGGGAYTSNCDQNPPWDTYKTYIDALRTQGIATIIASGNDGLTNAISAPACISTAVSVGATTKSDTVASYSNGASFLSLLAPGGDGSTFHPDGTLTYSTDCSELLPDICSAVPTESPAPFAYNAGTSMAAPHVAGAFAMLKQQSPTATAGDIQSILESSGVPVTDSRNNITKPRIHLSGTPWLVRYNDNGCRVTPSKVVTDRSNNVYVAGDIQYSADCFNAPYRAFDYLILKYDGSGRLLWAARFHEKDVSYATDIALDEAGNVYVTGLTCTYDQSLANCAESDYVTIKYDGDGNQQWVARYSGPIGHALSFLEVDRAGNVYVAGSSCNSMPQNGWCPDHNYLVVKYDTNGNQLWNAEYTNSVGDDFVVDIVLDTLGNIYVGGASCEVLYQPGVCLDYDYAIVKYANNGERLWVARYDSGGTADGAADLAVDASGNVYVTGANGVLGGGFLTIKYDSNGNQLWAAPYGDCGDAYALAVDQLGNAYVAGSNADCSLPIIDHDYTVVKYDSNGNVSWIARNFNAGEDDYPTDIAVDGFGNVYITGVNCNSLYDPNDPSDCYDFKNVTLKYDANGVKLWSAQYYTGTHDSLAALSVNDAGNIYVSTGSCRDNDSCTFFDLVTLKYTP